MKLADKTCIPCQKGGSPLVGEAISRYLAVLGGGWQVIEDHHLEKVYKFKNFLEALAFTNAVGQIAEQQSHHPEITLSWGFVSMRLWTHKVDGLTENDFILAAKADGVYPTVASPAAAPKKSALINSEGDPLSLTLP